MPTMYPKDIYYPSEIERKEHSSTVRRFQPVPVDQKSIVNTSQGDVVTEYVHNKYDFLSDDEPLFMVTANISTRVLQIKGRREEAYYPREWYVGLKIDLFAITGIEVFKDITIVAVDVDNSEVTVDTDITEVLIGGYAWIAGTHTA